jgi:hypothetical protein
MDIAVEKVRELIEYLRMLDGKEDAGSWGEADDAFQEDTGDVHVSAAGDGTEQQIRGVINGLNVDEKADLVAMVWIGRGDFEVSEWPVAHRRAVERATGSTARYLLGIPNVGDLLEEGLAAMGYDTD